MKEYRVLPQNIQRVEADLIGNAIRYERIKLPSGTVSRTRIMIDSSTRKGMFCVKLYNLKEVSASEQIHRGILSTLK
jgi:hypothetical protein